MAASLNRAATALFRGITPGLPVALMVDVSAQPFQSALAAHTAQGFEALLSAAAVITWQCVTTGSVSAGAVRVIVKGMLI